MCNAKLSLCVKSKVHSSPGLLAAFQEILLETLSRHALIARPQSINPKVQIKKKKKTHNFKAYKQALAILLIKRSESFPLKSPVFIVTYIHLGGCNLSF